MARTKPSVALSKIFKAEQIRLRQLRQNREFQSELKQLEVIAKRLASGPFPPIPASELSTTPLADLFPTVDDNAFRDAADRFTERWGYRPRWSEKGKVILFMPSPVQMKIRHYEIIEINKKSEHHTFGDLDALEKWYRLQVSKWDRRRKRRLRPLDGLRDKVRELRQSGLTNQEILNRLDPPSKGRWTPRIDPRYQEVYEKHARRGNLDRAESAAERELRKLHRAEEAAARRIRDQLRYLIRYTQA